jgi:hypothetical protein
MSIGELRKGSQRSLRIQVAVVLSEKVDTTVSKGVLRMAGTAVGGTLGAIHAPFPSPPALQ